jgi:hypothetical protein
MNLYATLDDIKDLLQVGTDNDEQLLRALDAASRQIEKLTGRYFYCYEGTKYFDGGGSRMWLPEDILNITTLKLDQDGDATYESSLLTTDYILYPLNTYPKIRLEINPQGDYAGFASGIQKGIEITGVFGYADSATPYEARTTLSAGITAAVTTIPLTDAGVIETGETLRIGTEQMFVEEINANNATCKRGVNGTVAAIHVILDAVYAYYYPADIVQATLITAMRAWKRKDSAYADVIGAPETGQIITSKGIDPDVRELVSSYRRQEYV